MVRPMLLEENDLRIAAKCMIADHGPKAAAEADQRANRAAEGGRETTATSWRKIRDIVKTAHEEQTGQRSRALSARWYM